MAEEMKSKGVKSARSVYHTIGFRKASDAWGEPENIEDGLNFAYGELEKECKISEQERERAIKIMSEEVENYRKKAEEFNRDIAVFDHEKENLENKKKEHELKRGDISRTLSSRDKVEHYILVTVLIGLALLVCFIVYPMEMYYAFEGAAAKQSNNLVGNIVYPNYLKEAYSKGAGTFALFLFVGVIPLGIGLLLSSSIQNYGKTKEKKHIAIWVGLLMLILSFDVFIGYRIAQKIYMANVYMPKHDKGLAAEPFSIWTAVSDVNFWIVLLLCFVLYIILALLYNKVMSGKFFDLDGYIKAEHKLIDEQIKKIDKSIGDINLKVIETQKNIKQNEQEIAVREKSIEAYNKGWLGIPPAKLKTMAADFMMGWNSFLQNFYDEWQKSEF
ncbi:MAG: hypothetical protein LBT96_02940, partial [Campylobacteraceae bacterium]|nr:hypothetical protein [Campylobacteraceae bacterium]